MSYFLYKKNDNTPDLSPFKLELEIFPDYTFIGEYETAPNVYGKVFDESNNLVSNRDYPEYIDQRKYAYPEIGDQLDMLWHAMDDGLIPKIEPMYSEIKAVKEQYPKPSN
jgi:hypothetical protein